MQTACDAVVVMSDVSQFSRCSRACVSTHSLTAWQHGAGVPSWLAGAPAATPHSRSRNISRLVSSSLDKTDSARNSGQVHAREEDHARPGWTTSRRGQDSPWKSQSE